MTDEVANANLEPHRLPLYDMVMEGGVTSGVIYPKAVVQLSKQFRLKNIGGTSVRSLPPWPQRRRWGAFATRPEIPLTSGWKSCGSNCRGQGSQGRE